MNLHYDYIMQHYADRRSLVEQLAETHRKHPHIGFDVMGRSLEADGFFPAASVTLALMALHNVQGQQTFEVGEHLSSMLEHTTLETIPKDELRLPYDTFYIALPGCPHRVWGGTRTQWHTVEGIYVHRSAEAFTIMAWAGENERSFGHGDDAHIWVRLDMRLEDEDLETMVYHLLRDRKSERNDPMIDPIAVIEGSQDDGITDEVRDVQVKTLTAMYRIAVNLSLYLATPDPEVEPVEDTRAQAMRQQLGRVKSEGKRKKLQRQLDNRSKATVVRVGKSIEATAAAQVREHGSVSAHWVRGHYHHYWTGKGRTVKVRKWVLPYPKGLEPPSRRSYRVEDAEQSTEPSIEPESTT